MTSPAYLLGLRLTGRRVLVVGGGRVAQRRVPVLVDAGADVLLVAPEVTPALGDLAATGRLRHERRAYRPGDGDGAWLVHACTDDPAVNAEVAREAEERRTWCVRADDAAESAAWTPATGGATGVTVGVLAGGDPRRAAGIRDAVVEGIRDGTIAAHPGRGPHTGPHTGLYGGTQGGVALVGGGPGHPDLITVRGRQLLALADVVVVDRLAPRALLDELRPDVEVVDATKIPYGRSMAQEHINRLLIEHARAGRFVVRLKGGDPFVFGRGAEEVLACAEAGVSVEVVPGVTSAVAVPAAAGVPVTHRGVAQEIHVVSAHVPPDDQNSGVEWEYLGRSRGTLVLLMAVERLDAVAHALMRYGRAPDTPVAIVQDGTLPSQHALTATLGTVAAEAAAKGIRPPAVVVVGDVVKVAQEIEVRRSKRDA